ncbi:MAG: ABC transporter permease [Bacilli bacterium]|nr:ABC transporter permease [Bacilli bacterium]
MLIFWTLAFPLILGTFFYMAFSNIMESETLDTIYIAMVTDNEESAVVTALKELNNQTEMIVFQKETKEVAESLLAEKEISGILFLENKTNFVIRENGIKETIAKYVCDEIIKMTHIIEEKINVTLKEEFVENQKEIEAIIFRCMEEMNQYFQNYVPNLQNENHSNLNYIMIEYYTLIAMSCLYGGIISLMAVNQTLANMTEKGKRISVAPVKKGIIIFSNVIASYCIQLFGLVILFAYTIFILKVDYGSHLLKMIALALTGALTGVSIGIFLACIFKIKESLKLGILLAYTMFNCFLSGMMGVTMKYVVDQNIPILNQINPANMITDGFYALYYYETDSRYYQNLIHLLLFASFLLILSSLRLRSQKYDNI